MAILALSWRNNSSNAKLIFKNSENPLEEFRNSKSHHSGIPNFFLDESPILNHGLRDSIPDSEWVRRLGVIGPLP